MGNDQILAELIQVGAKILCSEIHKFINYIWKVEELPHQEEYILFLFSRKMIMQTVEIIEAYHCCQLHRKIYSISLSQR
jgi:hypothetical protein